MSLRFESDDLRLYLGDVRQELRTLDSESVDCVVTSPPYWKLRDYGFPEQLGLEPTPQMYVANMVDVFREIRRVLAPHGTVWLNLGDSFNNRSVGRQSSHQGGLGFESDDLAKSWADLTTEGRTRLSIEDGELKEKDLVGIPWMLAFALRAGWSICNECGLELRTDLWPRWDGQRLCIDCLRDGAGDGRITISERGWWLRAGIVWAKPNGMPESVEDRPTRSHELVFMLAKSERYWFDKVAVLEPHSGRSSGNLARKHGIDVGRPDETTPTGRRGDLGRSVPWTPPTATNPDVLTLDGFGPPPATAPDGRKVTSIQAGQHSEQHRNGERWPNPDGKNIRDVWRTDPERYAGEIVDLVLLAWEADIVPDLWTVAPQPYKGAHFAVMPEELARRCVLAGAPLQVCRICGTPRHRIVESESEATQPGSGKAGNGDWTRTDIGNGRAGMFVTALRDLGWTLCGCMPDGTELFEKDALELVETPTGIGTGRTGIDPTPETGRRGLGRPRADDAGVRPISRYEQRRYARQLKASPHRAEMEAGVGQEAFAHYIRTDRSGARPIPPDALEAWLRAGWIEMVEPPNVDAADWPGKWRPGIVMDPFVGSGTVPKVARDNQRHAIGIDGKEDYIRLAIERNAQMTIFTEEVA